MNPSKKLYVCIVLFIGVSSTQIQAGKVAQLAGATTVAAFAYCGCKIAKDNEQYRRVMDANMHTLAKYLNKNSKEEKITLEQYNPPADKVFQAINAGLQLASYTMITTSKLLNDLSNTVFKSAEGDNKS